MQLACYHLQIEFIHFRKADHLALHWPISLLLQAGAGLQRENVHAPCFTQFEHLHEIRAAFHLTESNQYTDRPIGICLHEGFIVQFFNFLSAMQVSITL